LAESGNSGANSNPSKSAYLFPKPSVATAKGPSTEKLMVTSLQKARKEITSSLAGLSGASQKTKQLHGQPSVLATVVEPRPVSCSGQKVSAERSTCALTNPKSILGPAFFATEKLSNVGNELQGSAQTFSHKKQASYISSKATSKTPILPSNTAIKQPSSVTTQYKLLNSIPNRTLQPQPTNAPQPTLIDPITLPVTPYENASSVAVRKAPD
jgi:hypothetical protein